MFVLLKYVHESNVEFISGGLLKDATGLGVLKLRKVLEVCLNPNRNWDSKYDANYI